MTTEREKALVKALCDTAGVEQVDLLAAGKAVDKVIESLRQSDFAWDYGSQAVEGLKTYKWDMAMDIAKALGGKD